jgi:hypothetical protein
VGEDIMDLFLRAAILVPHLEYRRILFRYPSNALCGMPYRCGIYLGMFASVLRGCSLCRRLLVRTLAQRFGKDRNVELFWSI